MFFLQMSGFPGSGKSTLAREIAKQTGAIIMDHDIVKSALLESVGSTIEAKAAGQAAYHIEWSLIDFHLSQGHSVILDSPCLYEEMVEKGVSLAKKHKARYKYVECYLKDMQEINTRLKTRKRMICQIEQVASEEGFRYAIENSKKPSDMKCLTVDSSQPIESYLNNVIEYLEEN